MTASPAPRLSATDRRTAWMEDLFSAHCDWYRENRTPAPIELVDETLARIAAEGPALGRTDRWQGAVAFFAAEVAENGSEDHRRWTLTQGSVWLGYANI